MLSGRIQVSHFLSLSSFEKSFWTHQRKSILLKKLFINRHFSSRTPERIGPVICGNTQLRTKDRAIHSVLTAPFHPHTHGNLDLLTLVFSFVFCLPLYLRTDSLPCSNSAFSVYIDNFFTLKSFLCTTAWFPFAPMFQCSSIMHTINMHVDSMAGRCSSHAGHHIHLL